ncbi:type IX secretion system membrane protein PorP/SprF [Owenweeksia hongkongensis]|uniref:PorP/SprF family type IX secretion system membrane protein n=1 Tax=Owenweeksia hongkongensis TaxID=253245 RepID=UPI003A8CE374
MKKIYIMLLTGISYLAVGQQDLQFTQFMFNKIYYNPAVAGSGGAICVNALHRSQWVGFEGAPTSQNLNINAPIKKLHGGLALKVSNDQIGYFQNFNVGLGYAYQMELANGTLGFGLNLELFTSSVNNAEWVAPDGTTGFDPSITAPITQGITFDGSLGIYYENDTWWAGISSARLAQSSTELDNNVNPALNPTLSTITDFYNRRHYYIMGGYNWAIPNSNIDLRPSLLLKSDFGASSVVDVNVMGVYNNKFWGGVTYRLTEAVAVNVGYQFTESLKAGYSYDIGINGISQQGGGSHEIFLSYCFKIEIPPRQKGSYKNPRFL